MKKYTESVKENKDDYKVMGFAMGALGVLLEGVAHFAIEDEEVKTALTASGLALGASGIAIGLGAGPLAKLDANQAVKAGLVAPSETPKALPPSSLPQKA